MRRYGPTAKRDAINVYLISHCECSPWIELQFLHQVRHGDETLVDSGVGVLGMYGEPPVGVAVTAEDELQAVPLFNREARRSRR
jgi:hypothetical protein